MHMRQRCKKAFLTQHSLRQEPGRTWLSDEIQMLLQEVLHSLFILLRLNAAGTVHQKATWLDEGGCCMQQLVLCRHAQESSPDNS